MSSGTVAAIAGTGPPESPSGPGVAVVEVGPADPPSFRGPQKCHAPNTRATPSRTAAPSNARVRADSPPRDAFALVRLAECRPEPVRTGTRSRARRAAAAI